MSEENKTKVNPIIWVVVGVAVVAAVLLFSGGVDGSAQWVQDAFAPKD